MTARNFIRERPEARSRERFRCVGWRLTFGRGAEATCKRPRGGVTWWEETRVQRATADQETTAAQEQRCRQLGPRSGSGYDDDDGIGVTRAAPQRLETTCSIWTPLCRPSSSTKAIQSPTQSLSLHRRVKFFRPALRVTLLFLKRGKGLATW